MTLHGDEKLADNALNEGNYEEAIRLLKPLAERNSEFALLTLGWLYDTGATGTPDRAAARSCYEHAASLGSAAAHHYLGSLLLRGGEEVEARAAFERGAQLNNEESKSALARLDDSAAERLAAKALKEEAIEEAIGLLRPLAERNSEYALLCLGSLYQTGDAGTLDKEAARSYFERAAALGSVEGSFELGKLLVELGDDQRGRAAFLAAAEQGHLPSMSRLGRMMVEGRGGSTDMARGTAWLQKAAVQGHIMAQRALLDLEEREARTLPEKLSVKKRIMELAMKAVRQRIKDPETDKRR